MNQPLPQRLQELAAGYVLGNLDAEELQEFQTLSQQFPSQEIFTAELQALMHQLPYALTELQPPASLGDRIINAAAPQPRKRQWQLWALGLTTMSAIGLGLDNLRVRHQLAQIESPPPLQIVTSPQVLEANWGGITQVLDDHIRAKKRGGDAIEIKAQEQTELFKILQSKDLALPAMLPNLPTETVQFLGGAICKFDKTVGIRVMYQTQESQPISLYQLHRAGSPNFPAFLSDPLVIQTEAGPNLLLWGDEKFLFAIVGDLSKRELNTLSQQLNYSAI